MQTIQIGSEGPDVLLLQKALNAIYEEQLDEDGVCGGQTEDMVLAFQAEADL